MNKSLPFVIALLIMLTGASVFLLRQKPNSDEEERFQNVLVKTEDVVGTDLYVRYQEIYGANYYDMPDSEEFLTRWANHLLGDYKKDSDRQMFINSALTKYAGSADPYIEDSKEDLSNYLGTLQLQEEFVPEFESSSYYQYRQCVKVMGSDRKESFMCVVSTVVKQNYLFTVVLHGNGNVSNIELNNLLGIVLKDKQAVLERLP